MATDRFMIGFTDGNSGLQTNVKPWLIADNAFAELSNAYIYRGRLRKRFGSFLMGESQINSRLRIRVGNTTVPGAIPGVLAFGQIFSVGDEIYTIYQDGAMLASTAGATGTVNIGANTYVINSLEPAGTAIYWYPSLPVMGITQYLIGAINSSPSFAFDTRFAYKFDETTAGWERLAGGTDIWSGTDSQFFWSCNYYGATPNLNILFTTNFNATDRIRYWDQAGLVWVTPTFRYAAGLNEILTSRIIVSFKNRLILLNTVETFNGVVTEFVARCRFSGTGSPLAANAWRGDIPGNGNFVNASTQEAIITAQIIKDRLIVYFERSTWELVYQGNQINPFTWQKINTELGAESTFSQVPFDKAVIGIGQVGIHACNGANVERIDVKIPQKVWSFHNQNSGVIRIAGIRDYFTEMVYWTYPTNDRSANNPYPNKVLTYNYTNNSWAVNDDSFTAFGYYQLGAHAPATTWASLGLWTSTDVWGGSEYDVPLSRRIIAGNQQGWIVILDNKTTRNAPSLQITNVVAATNTCTIIDHNLVVGDFVFLENMNGLVIENAIMRVLQVVDEDTVVLTGGTITGTYIGGGTISRVSRIDIKTKQYNFYAAKDRNAYISKIDFLIDTTASGRMSVDFYISTSFTEMVADGSISGALLGTSVLETSPYAPELAPMEWTQDRVWHPLYFQAEGECIQLHLYFNNVQMADTEISLADFQLHAMNFEARPTSSRLQ